MLYSVHIIWYPNEFCRLRCGDSAGERIFYLQNPGTEAVAGSAVIVDFPKPDDVCRPTSPLFLIGFVVHIVLSIQELLVNAFFVDLDFAPYLITDSWWLKEQ